jgi:hypothetical protein
LTVATLRRPRPGQAAGRRDDHAELQGRGPQPDHPGGQRGHRQEFHHRSARQRQGHDAVGDADVAGAFYEAFLAVLQVYGYVAVPAGKVIKIVPNTDARQLPSIDLPNDVSSTSDEIVTQIITLKNISAAQLVPMLRPADPRNTGTWRPIPAATC